MLPSPRRVFRAYNVPPTLTAAADCDHPPYIVRAGPGRTPCPRPGAHPSPRGMKANGLGGPLLRDRAHRASKRHRPSSPGLSGYASSLRSPNSMGSIGLHLNVAAADHVGSHDRPAIPGAGGDPKRPDPLRCKRGGSGGVSGEDLEVQAGASAGATSADPRSTISGTLDRAQLGDPSGGTGRGPVQVAREVIREPRHHGHPRVASNGSRATGRPCRAITHAVSPPGH